ncbi:hypothetical protein ACQKOE_13995 [Novosphingobium sp. NPDC080210]|uniref:hypothetical protein n=1 Tax=Novosphingobium sp. NPDC080210 TaxID=3390596 RepID=UPI003CFC8F16
MSQSRTRTEYACLKSALAWRPDPTAGTVAGSFTLDRKIEQARKEMGEDRWAQLQAEWSAK